ncbi:hypothetical protein NPIL_199101, partial [Nephila pilipes]
MTQDPPSLPYPPTLPYHPVQSTLALPVKENRRLNQIQVYTSIRQVTKRELAQHFSIHNDYVHPEYKSLKNPIRLFTKELKRLE